MTLDSISRELVNGLPHSLRDPNSSDSAWTRAINDVLARLGLRKELFVCGHGCKNNSEWLLDVLWMRESDWSIVLAVESEWKGPGEVESDFLKLLSIKAPRKMMLFGTKDQTAAIVKSLESLMSKYPYHIAGEEYLLIDVMNRGAARHSFTVPNDGLLKSVKFSETSTLNWPWTATTTAASS